MIKSHETSVYLDLSCSKEKVQDFLSDKKELRKSIITRFSHGYGAKTKLAMRKLDNIGYIKSYGGVQNNTERLHQLKNKLEFSQLLAIISLLEQRDYHQEKDAINTELQVLAPAEK